MLSLIYVVNIGTMLHSPLLQIGTIGGCIVYRGSRISSCCHIHPHARNKYWARFMWLTLTLCFIHIVANRFDWGLNTVESLSILWIDLANDVIHVFMFVCLPVAIFVSATNYIAYFYVLILTCGCLLKSSSIFSRNSVGEAFFACLRRWCIFLVIVAVLCSFRRAFYR